MIAYFYIITYICVVKLYREYKIQVQLIYFIIMEIIEKQVEKVKEVPCGYWDNCYDNYGYRRNYNGGAPFASKGVAGTGLGLK